MAAAFAGLVLAVLTLSGPAASAHATLVGSTPADGAQLAEAPDEVTLEFSSSVQTPATVVVTAPDGSPAADGEAEVDGKVVTLPVRDAGEGGYTVAYRVLSTDGHQVTGTLSFTVGADGSAAASPTAQASPADSAAPATDAADDGGTGGPTRRTALMVGVPVLAWLGALVLWWLSRRPAPQQQPAE